MRTALLVAGFAAACLLAAQEVDRDKYAREYVQFLTLELDEWTKSFPHDYNLALMRPPVDASKLSDAAKAGANELRDSILFLRGTTPFTPAFTTALERTLGFAKQINEATGKQRFPALLQSD